MKERKIIPWLSRFTSRQRSYVANNHGLISNKRSLFYLEEVQKESI